MKNKSWLILFSVFSILVLISCSKTQYVCSDGSTVSDASLCLKEEKPQQIFSLGAFNPVWATYSGYKCAQGKLTIQANTLNSLENIKLPSNAHFECHFNVGDYIKKDIIPSVNDNIGDFDTFNGYSITLCCKAKNYEGNQISGEYCKTEYLKPLC